MSTLTVSNINGNPGINASSMSIGSNAVTPFAGFKNKIINGNFDFWQRGSSFSNPAGGTLCADRWLLYYDGAGATRTLSRQAFTIGQTDVPNEPVYFFRWNQSVAGSGGTTNILTQRIEGVRTLAGQTITVSFYAKASSSVTMPDIYYYQYFGTGGSPSSPVTASISTNISLTTSWQKFAFTYIVPSISGKTLGSNNDDYTELCGFGLPRNATFTIDIAQVQIEAGSVATPFEMRPLQTELALCQRYFQAASTFIYAGSFARICYMFPVPMRVAPTLAGGGAGFNATNLTAAGFCADQTASAIQSMTYSAELT